MKMDNSKRDFLGALVGAPIFVTTAMAAPHTIEQQLPPLRTVDWVLDSTSGLVLDANAGLVRVGAWIGAVLPGDRFRASRLAVLRIIGNAGEDIVFAVEIGRAERERVPRLSTAFALQGSRWQPVNGVALVVSRPGGWLMQMTLVSGGS